MFSFLFFAKTLFVVFLFVTCAFCELAHADDPDAKTPEKIELFKTGGTGKNIIPENGEANRKDEIDIKLLYSPFLIAADNVIVAIVGANCTKDSKKTAILTRYIEVTKTHNWAVNAFNNAKINENWKAQFAFQKTAKNENPVKSLAAVATKNKIYGFMVNNSENSEDEEESEEKKWDCVIIEGSIERKTSLKITWTATKKLDLLKDKNLKSYPQFLSSFVTNEETVVFFVKGETQDSKKNFAIIYFKDSEPKLKDLLVVNTAGNCDPYLFLWKEKIIMISFNCEEIANQKIQEFDLTNEKLKESDKSLGRVWGFLKEKKNIITTTIDGTPVVLFTQKRTKTPGNENDIHLWVTDGNRSYNVGSIVDSGDEEVIVANLLYTKDRLFSLHQETESKNIILTNLEEQLKKIKVALTAWKDSDEKIQRLCAATATSPEITCTTDGLVGFLSGIFSGKTQEGNKWKDNYLNEHATIYGSGEIKDNNGVKFNGANAGAMWLVGKQKDEDQPYNFADFGFTLIATVTIETVTNEKNSVLGISFKKAGGEVATNGIGLWCAKKTNWAVSVRKDESDFMDSKKECGPGKTYSIALAFEKTKPLKIYVNGEQLQNLGDEKMKIHELESIKHFYFGANEKEENTAADVTITNVLLYNRLLTSQELKAFKPKESEIETEQKIGNTDTKQNPEEGTTQTDSSPLNTSPTENKEEKEIQSSSTPTTEDSAARVGVVGVLCFMLFGVFTLLGRYVY